MEPKFQSSFIPKGPLDPTSNERTTSRRHRTVFSLLASLIFLVSVVLAGAVFGYKIYLKNDIRSMGEELQKVRVSLDTDSINELIRLDNRILSVRSLVSGHVSMSPFLEFLEINTLNSVRFNTITYSTTPEGVTVELSGESRGYSSLALQADVFKRGDQFQSQTFSQLTLNEAGNVAFNFTGVINPNLISYGRTIEALELPPVEDLSTASTTLEAELPDEVAPVEGVEVDNSATTSEELSESTN